MSPAPRSAPPRVESAAISGCASGEDLDEADRVVDHLGVVDEQPGDRPREEEDHDAGDRHQDDRQPVRLPAAALGRNNQTKS